MRLSTDIAPRGLLSEAIANVAIKRPENGYRFQDMKGEEHFYSFVKLERATAEVAQALQARGLKKGDRVGLVLIEPRDFVLTFLACIRIGVIPVPLYPPLALGDLDNYVEKIRSILTTAGAVDLVVTPALKNILWSAVDLVPSLRRLTYVDDLRGDADAVIYPEIEPEDIAFLQYTSGSTSTPKGVIVTHANLFANCMTIVEDGLELTPDDKPLSWLPLYHDMGLIGFVIAPLYSGMTTTFIPTLRFLKRPNVWLETAHHHRCTVSFVPPFALGLAVRRSKPADLDRWDLSCLRLIGVGAEPIPMKSVREFTEHFGRHCGLSANTVTPAYGMAEATLAISLKAANVAPSSRIIDAPTFAEEGRAVEAAAADENTLEHVACGWVFPDHEIEVRDDAGNPVPDGCEGQICLRGPSITPGYFQNPEATAEAFREGWLHTGDLGYVLDRQIYVTGRMKDLIIVNGRNYHPQSLEWPIAQIEGVRPGNVVAFSVPGETTEEVVIALEQRPEAPADLEERVMECVRQESGLTPVEIVLLDAGQLPKTSSGKLQRRRTRDLFLSGKLGRQGNRTAGGNADRITLARHVARSVWSRVKHSVSNT